MPCESVCGRCGVWAPGAGGCDRGATNYFVEPTIRGRECGRARHECSSVRRRFRARVDAGNVTSLSTRAWQSCAACVRLSIRQRALMTDPSSRHRMPALSCRNFHATGGRSVVPVQDRGCRVALIRRQRALQRPSRARSPWMPLRVGVAPEPAATRGGDTVGACQGHGRQDLQRRAAECAAGTLPRNASASVPCCTARAAAMPRPPTRLHPSGAAQCFPRAPAVRRAGCKPGCVGGHLPSSRGRAPR